MVNRNSLLSGAALSAVMLACLIPAAFCDNLTSAETLVVSEPAIQTQALINTKKITTKKHPHRRAPRVRSGSKVQPANHTESTSSPPKPPEQSLLSAPKTFQPDDTVITSVGPYPGTVRVNNLANLETVLNIIANGSEIIGIAWGISCFVSAIKLGVKNKPWVRKVIFGLFVLTSGLATPGCINWLVGSARGGSSYFS